LTADSPDLTIDASLGVAPPSPRLSRRLVWGLIDQGASSATNFGLSLLAGRLLGASGLGVITVGFSAYLAVLVFHRALLSEPLVITSSTADADDQAHSSGAGISGTVVLGIAAAVGIGLIGFFLKGPIGRGLVLFAPWILPALLQDLWRLLLFRDGRGAAAAANDGLWLLGMLLALPVVWAVRADWVITASWGFGAAVSALVGFAQVHSRPVHLIDSWAWMRRDVWPFARWLGAEAGVYTVAAQLLVFALAGLVGTTAVGGLRSIQVIFAPLSLLGPAIGMPALPAITRLHRVSVRSARRAAAKISVLLLILTTMYLVGTGLRGQTFLSFVFGKRFAGYRDLIWPVGATQLLGAINSGFYLFLKASRRGKSVLLSRTFTAVATLSFATGLSIPYHIAGAAWGMCLGMAVGSATTIVLAYRSA
jgi:O-antigen/teichoic acid export membrane protein